MEQVATIISLLGSVAIFLAVVGLLGLVSYAVSQRTKEIAIRLALGAKRTEIFSAVLRRFAWPVLIGLVAGVAITAGLSQILRRGLYGISGLDPISYLGAITLLIVVLVSSRLAADPESLSDRHRKNPAFRLEQRRRWRIAACALLFVVPEGNLRLQPLPHKQNCHRRPVFRRTPRLRTVRPNRLPWK